MFQLLAEYAEGLNTTPLEVLRLFFYAGAMFFSVLGGLSVLFFYCLLDRFCNGIVAFFHWLRSRKEKGH